MSFSLLAGSQAFHARLVAELAEAQDRAYVQVLSFEADAVGLPIARKLMDADHLDRRILADAFFTRHFINDRFVHAPSNRRDRGLQAELEATQRMFEELATSGAQVALAHPAGPLLWKALRRGHKKIIVVDEAAYVGGINFSEHNFAWRDLMLRIEHPALVEHLASDLCATMEDRVEPSSKRIDGTTVLSLDGATNPSMFAPLLEAIASAERTVEVISPYLSPPFTGALARAAGNGAHVSLITPETNNWPLFRTATLDQARRHGFDVYLYPERMNHTKAMLIDGQQLVLGSSNFDLFSYHLHDELVLILEDPELIDTFQRDLLEPDRRASHVPASWPSRTAGALARTTLATLGQLVRGYATVAHRSSQSLEAIHAPGSGARQLEESSAS